MEEYIVRMENIQKNFGTVKAVRSGQFNLKKGEIHSIIGENGAGKSTMMKMLYGMYPIDGGKIFLNGQELTHYTTKDAIAAGIGMVHQEFMLVNELTVLENVILGFEPTKGLAIVNIGGLTAGILVALFILPVYYAIMNGKKERKVLDI